MKKFFIGIDFSKEKFDATAIFTENGQSASNDRPHSSFENNRKGFKEFCSWISRQTGESSLETIILCGENTGIYSQFISDQLYMKGYTMWLESALQIKRSMGIQRIKSDKADSEAIAEYAMRFHDRMTPYVPLKDSLKAIREIFMYRAQLVKEKKGLKTRLNEKLSTDAKISKVQRFMRTSSTMIVNRLNKEINKCDEMMKDIIEKDEELWETYEIVTSIKGIALQNAAIMMVYTNNFAKFDYNPRKLACYYGIAPFGKQSGTSVHTQPHTSPFAQGMIKALLTQAALSAIVYCPEIREYYHRLLSRGKKPMVAQNNVKNKLIHIITAMVRNKQKYNPDWSACHPLKTVNAQIVLN